MAEERRGTPLEFKGVIPHPYIYPPYSPTHCIATPTQVNGQGSGDIHTMLIRQQSHKCVWRPTRSLQPHRHQRTGLTPTTSTAPYYTQTPSGSAGTSQSAVVTSVMKDRRTAFNYGHVYQGCVCVSTGGGGGWLM